MKKYLSDDLRNLLIALGILSVTGILFIFFVSYNFNKDIEENAYQSMDPCLDIIPQYIQVGDEVELSAGLYAHGYSICVLEASNKFVWESSDTSVFEIMKPGVIKAKKTGEATLYVKRDSLKTLTQTLRSIPQIEKFDIIPSHKKLSLTDTLTLKIIAFDKQENQIILQNLWVDYPSDKLRLLSLPKEEDISSNKGDTMFMFSSKALKEGEVTINITGIARFSKGITLIIQ